MRMMMVGWVVALAACSAAGTTGGTSSGTSSSSSSGGAATFTIGSAGPGEAHLDAPDGTPVMMAMGPQGGQHIWLSVGFTSQPAQDYPLFAYEIVDGTTTLSSGRTRMSPRQVAGGWEDSGIPMMFDWGTDVSGWTDHPVRVTVRLLDDNDQELGRIERQWMATCCALGGGRGPDGGVGNGAPDAGPLDGMASCAAFCDGVMDGCAASGVELPFASNDACLSACAQWPNTGTPAAGGDSLQCRMHHALVAEDDASSCVRLGDLWDTFCVSR